MSGCTKGIAARISTQHPKALYTHCAAHRLNLCVVKCCSIREVSNMMEPADSITRFSITHQSDSLNWRNGLLTSVQMRKSSVNLKKCAKPDGWNVMRLLMCCRLIPALSCLEEIYHVVHHPKDTRHEAQSYLLALSQFSFIVAITFVDTEDSCLHKGNRCQITGQVCEWSQSPPR